jgi:hypothetical protein
MKYPVSLQSRGIQQLLGNSQSLFVIDAGKCFGPPPPGETVLQNGDSTAEGVLYPAGGGPKHFPVSITNKLRVFLIVVVYHVIVSSLVT